MSNNTEHDDGGTGVVKTDRRTVLKGIGASTAAAATLGAGTGSVAAQDNNSTGLPSGDEAADFVGQDNGAYALYEDSARAAAGMSMLMNPLGPVAAVAAGADSATKGIVNEWLFGSHSPDAAINEDAHNAAYSHLGDASISLRQALNVWQQNDFAAMEQLGYAIMETEAVTALNEKEPRSSAKTRAKQRVRDEVLVTPERNLVKLAEAICIRISGIYWVWQQSLENGYLSTDPNYDYLTPRTGSYWKWDSDGADYDWVPDTDGNVNIWQSYISQFDIRESTVELMNGEEIPVGLLEIITVDDVGGSEDNPTSAFTGFALRSGDLTWTGREPRDSIGSTNDSYSNHPLDQIAFYHGGEDANQSVSDYIGQGEINQLYDDLYSLKDTLETEAEQLVDAIYDDYDPGDLVDPGDRSPGSMVQQSGSNWATTGNSNYAEIWGATTGMGVDGDAPTVTLETLSSDGSVQSTYEGVLIPQSAASNYSALSYASDAVSVDPAAGSNGELTVSKTVLAPGQHTYEWTDGSGATNTVTIAEDAFSEQTNDSGETTGYTYAFGADDSAPTGSDTISSQSLSTETAGVVEGDTSTEPVYIATEEADADMEARLETVDPSSQSDVAEWRASSIDGQWYVAFEKPMRPSGDGQVSNEELKDLWDRYEELQQKLDRTNEEEDPVTAGGGAGGGGGLLDGIDGVTLALGSGIAALLAAAGLSGGGSE